MASRTFGELVREHREGIGLTQAALATRAGVSMMGVSFLETGRVSDPHVSTLAKLSRALGVDAALLLQPFTQSQ